MIMIFGCFQSLTDEESAQDMVEYALLAGFVAVAAGVVLPNIGHQVWHIFETLEDWVIEAAKA